MYAAKGNHPHCCNELLLRDADVTLVNLNDDTAFNLAVDNHSNLGMSDVDQYIGIIKAAINLLFVSSTSSN